MPKKGLAPSTWEEVGDGGEMGCKGGEEGGEGGEDCDCLCTNMAYCGPT